MYTEQKLTPEQKERLKKIISHIIDDDDSCFFFGGTTGQDAPPEIMNSLALTKGNPEILIRAIVNQTNKDTRCGDRFIKFFDKVLHICAMSRMLIQETFKHKAKNN